MKRFPEVFKKQEGSFEDSYSSLDVASQTDCTGMVPTPPLTEVEAENYGDIYSMPQQNAYNAQNNQNPSKQEIKSSVKG